MGKFNKTGKKEMPALNTSSLPDLISVSYTHLDVYKRQRVCSVVKRYVLNTQCL